MFIRSTGSHPCFLIALFRLQDVLSVAFHLGCFLEFVSRVEPTTMGIVSIFFADGACDDGLGHVGNSRLDALLPELPRPIL